MVEDSGDESQTDTMTGSSSLADRLALIIARKPLSFNSGGKEKYKQAIAEEARSRWMNDSLVGDLYARVLWFYRERAIGRDGDADNISKPILDSLTGIAYQDDRQVVKRLVQKVYTGDAFQLVEARASGSMLRDLTRLLGEPHPHIIYIEVGRFLSRDVVLGPIDGVSR